MQNLEIFSLKGKTAIVTGGSGLYGRQITLALAEAGAKVVIASRNKIKNEEYAESLRKQGYNVVSETLDQGDEESIKALADKLEKEGGTDILVNNSVLRTMKDYHDDLANFNESMRVNATGIFAMCRVFGDKMAKQGKGSIINIGSYMGLLGADDTLYRGCEFSGYNSPDYFFHKGGMTNLTRFIASYYGPKNVRCNILEPGGYYTRQNPLKDIMTELS